MGEAYLALSGADYKSVILAEVHRLHSLSLKQKAVTSIS